MMQENDLFTILDDVESTNNYAMAKVHAGLAAHGQAWFANEQWGGRGQREKVWISAKGENIIMTVVLKPNKVFNKNLFLFSAMVAGVCHRFFSAVAGNETTIKWPNDIYFGDRKAGGILIENIFKGSEWIWAAVGIGINVNQIDFKLAKANATSLQIICNKIFEPIELGKKLHRILLENFEESILFPDDYYFNYYNEHLYKKNQSVKLKKGNMVFTTTIKEVNRKGQLVTLDTLERQFNNGEVKWSL